MPQLVLIRHGESTWNLDNRFTGWVDIGLTEHGIRQAKAAGELLKTQGFEFDIAYTSVLKRAVHTLWHVLDAMDSTWIPVAHTWRLNERHYGALQGLNKAETVARHSEEQVHIWRRSYDVRPPLLDDAQFNEQLKDRRYAKLKPQEMPRGECLKDTVERVLPFWQESCVPAIQSGRRVVISAHGNSLRALVKYLENLSDQEIVERNIPNGQPFVYELDQELKVKSHYYLETTAVV